MMPEIGPFTAIEFPDAGIVAVARRGDSWIGAGYLVSMDPQNFGVWMWMLMGNPAGRKVLEVMLQRIQSYIPVAIPGSGYYPVAVFPSKNTNPRIWRWVWVFNWDKQLVTLLTATWADGPGESEDGLPDTYAVVALIHLDGATPDWEEIERRAAQI